MNDTFDTVQWRPVFSQKEMIGVWEEVGNDEDWRWRIEMYHDGDWYLGRVLSLRGLAAEGIEKCGGDEKKAIDYLYNAIYESRSAELNEDSDIAGYVMGLCDGHKFVAMMKGDEANGEICNALFYINEDGTLLRQREAGGWYSILARQEDRYISAPFRGTSAEHDTWLPVTSCTQIAGAWEKQTEDFWHTRYEIYEDGSCYFGKVSNHFKAVTARAEAAGCSALEAWDDLFTDLEQKNRTALDAKKDLARYAIGKCSGFTYAEMYGNGQAGQAVFNTDGYEMSAEGSRLRRYNQATGEYEVYIRKERSYISESLKTAGA